MSTRKISNGMTKWPLTVVALALLLGGCMSLAPNYQTPALDLPANAAPAATERPSYDEDDMR